MNKHSNPGFLGRKKKMVSYYGLVTHTDIEPGNTKVTFDPGGHGNVIVHIKKCSKQQFILS